MVSFGTKPMAHQAISRRPSAINHGSGGSVPGRPHQTRGTGRDGRFKALAFRGGSRLGDGADPPRVLPVGPGPRWNRHVASFCGPNTGGFGKQTGGGTGAKARFIGLCSLFLQAPAKQTAGGGAQGRGRRAGGGEKVGKRRCGRIVRRPRLKRPAPRAFLHHTTAAIATAVAGARLEACAASRKSVSRAQGST